MNKLIIISLAITACFSSGVMAKHNSNYDYARVVKATPVYDYVTHRIR
ncbi:hypothetical protein L3Q72_05385 [Vibrio sp. JC009]|nr:hypothetical protein [Vibrio sp. JC009]WED22826.1 hypothetical protein L3Q72_05385 [Vibrio sp. JC009]